MEQLTEEEIQTALLVATMFNSITEKYPDVLTDKKLYTEGEAKKLAWNSWKQAIEPQAWDRETEVPRFQKWWKENKLQ